MVAAATTELRRQNEENWSTASAGQSVSSRVADPVERAKAISIELRRVARRARASTPISSGGGGFRARSSDRLFRHFLIGSFVLLFVVPTLIASIYYGAIAADQYVTEVRFAVRSSEQGGFEALSGLGGLIDAGQSRDAQIIGEYVRSRAMLEEVQKKFDLHRLFDRDDFDFFGKMDRTSTAEEVLEFWRGQIHINIDKTSGLVTLEVRAFTPQDSLALAQAVVEASEAMVNHLFRRKEVDAQNKATEELERAKSRLEAAVGALRDARNRLGVLDVDIAAKAYGEIMTMLRGELAKNEQEIDGLARDAQDAPQLGSLRARAESLRKQIRAYEQALAGGPGSVDGADVATLATRAALLAEKDMDVKIARSEYAGAVSVYERARMTLESQRAYLLTHVTPRLAEKSLYPKRWFMWGAALFLSFLAWAIVAGLGFLVRDNMAT